MGGDAGYSWVRSGDTFAGNVHVSPVALRIWGPHQLILQGWGFVAGIPGVPRQDGLALSFPLLGRKGLDVMFQYQRATFDRSVLLDDRETRQSIEPVRMESLMLLLGIRGQGRHRAWGVGSADMRRLLLLFLSLSLSCSSGSTFLQQPERVQIFLTDMDFSSEAERSADPRPHSGPLFVHTREGPELNEAERLALVKTWAAPRRIPRGEEKACLFNPDITLRFWRGTEWVDVVVCFGCGEQQFFDADGDRIRPGTLSDFTLLRRIAKQAFPDSRFRER